MAENDVPGETMALVAAAVSPAFISKTHLSHLISQ